MSNCNCSCSYFRSRSRNEILAPSNGIMEERKGIRMNELREEYQTILQSLSFLASWSFSFLLSFLFFFFFSYIYTDTSRAYVRVMPFHPRRSICTRAPPARVLIRHFRNRSVHLLKIWYGTKVMKRTFGAPLCTKSISYRSAVANCTDDDLVDLSDRAILYSRLFCILHA